MASDRLSALEVENAVLKMRLAAVECADADPAMPPRGLPGLAATPSRFLTLLARRGFVTKRQMFDWLYADRSDPPQDKILDVMVCTLRRRLAPLGIRIETIWGRGWRVSPEGEARLAALYADEGGDGQSAIGNRQTAGEDGAPPRPP